MVELHFAAEVGHHRADKSIGEQVSVVIVDDHFADILAQVVADSTDDYVALLEQEVRRFGLLGFADYRIPEFDQVVEVPLQLFGGAADTGGADNHAHPFGDVEAAHCVAQITALFAFNAPRDTTSARVVGHQHHVAAGQTNIGGECSAF